VIYDDNNITIEGSTELAFTEDVVLRYRSYGWHTVEIEDSNDLEEVEAAVAAAKAETERPTLIRAKTHIGYGSPNKQDSEKAHGSPLGPDEVELTKNALGWPLEPTFHVPEEAVDAFAAARAQGDSLETAWNDLLERYRAEHPEPAAELDTRLAGELPEGWQDVVPTFQPEDGPLATRKASGAVLTAVAAKVPELLGGSADLAGSNNTYLKGEPAFSAREPGGRNFHFGVREHAMGAVMNGMALSKLLRPYGGTFLIFSDYMRPSVRLAALMGLPSIFIFTHDSIFLGEDGPTHQPISQLLSMRSIPNLLVLRPCDANETAEAWRAALTNQDGPTALVLTRQKLPILEETFERAAEGLPRGAYVVADPPNGEPQVILIASGSEVSLALEAHRQLLAEGVATRVVSMPCWSLFDAQDEAYRESVLPSGISRRLAIEAGCSMGWHKYVGPSGDILAQDGFGASAPLADLQQHFGFVPEEVIRRVKALVS
ncbi:MAG: transketolase, partial [Acidobacteriota bacterium]